MNEIDDYDICCWCGCENSDNPSKHDMKIPHGSHTISNQSSPAQKQKAREVFARPLDPKEIREAFAAKLKKENGGAR